MKIDSEQYKIKRDLISFYHDNYGIFVSLEEQHSLFKALDDTGLEMIMKKKL